jgi:hypothetical protein
LVEGWPLDDEGDACADNAMTDPRDIAESLVRQGLLTRSQKLGKPAGSRSLEGPVRSLDGELAQSPRIRWRHRARFVVAYFKTVVTFKWGSLLLALSTVAKRKMERSQGFVNQDAEETRELVDIFMRLRLRFYTAKRNCLFDSLTLSHFLAAHRIYPELVIGVSESPFRSHSWVQQGGTVLNYEFELVKEFCPVVAI